MNPLELEISHDNYGDALASSQSLPPTAENTTPSRRVKREYADDTEDVESDGDYIPDELSPSDSLDAPARLVSRRSTKKLRTNSRKAKESQNTSKAPATSKLSQRHEQLMEKYGTEMVTKDNRIRGNVCRGKRGNLFYWDVESEKWVLAAYHHDFRRNFIAIAAAQEPSYTKDPLQGMDDDDVTSNCGYMSQNTFQFSTPDQLGAIQDADGNRVMELEERPDRNIPVRNYLEYKGMVMLDQEDHPILDYGKMIPLTFSSQLEGGRIEALRRIVPGLQTQDIRARSKSFSFLLFCPDLSLFAILLPGINYHLRRYAPIRIH